MIICPPDLERDDLKLNLGILDIFWWLSWAPSCLWGACHWSRFWSLSPCLVCCWASRSQVIADASAGAVRLASCWKNHWSQVSWACVYTYCIRRIYRYVMWYVHICTVYMWLICNYTDIIVSIYIMCILLVEFSHQSFGTHVDINDSATDFCWDVFWPIKVHQGNE